ncbi:hypothetical protein PEPS_38410 (plasmid) [Persicobacter psychrovividus]|uniref:DUF4136 domain-containing protein n=2 Tax=Persicobacter psychrovividus TaxID=387638 RepID=A0ABM7VKQ5_9BACT|nr:hypothetical protein PEPS_38410 [Persicobacter psychrovividus]
MLKKVHSMLLLLGGILLLSACFPDRGPQYIDDLDLTITYYDDEFYVDGQANDQYKYFYITDTVEYIGRKSDSDAEEDFLKNFSPKLISEIRTSFTELGYELKDSDFVMNNPQESFAVNVTFLALSNQVIGGSPGWWWGAGYPGYWGWYGPGWGGGYWGGYYPWAPGYAYSYAYQTGTLMTEMVDAQSLKDYREWFKDKTEEEIENADPADIPPLQFRWQSLVDGIASNSDKANLNRLTTGIQQSFTQSPYLQRK